MDPHTYNVKHYCELLNVPTNNKLRQDFCPTYCIALLKSVSNKVTIMCLSGAQHCFKRDQERFLLHESSSDPHINELVLAIYLEVPNSILQLDKMKHPLYFCRVQSRTYFCTVCAF